MKKLPHHLITVVAAGAAVSMIAPQAIAQTFLEGRDVIYPEHTSEAFDRAIDYEIRDVDTSFDTWVLVNEYFGLIPFSFIQPSYPDHQAKRDFKKVDLLYKDIMLKQVASDPVLRTPDLPNPFNSSLLTESPQDETLRLLEGASFSFDR